MALWEEAIDSLMTSVESDERIDFRRAREVMGQLLDTNTRSVQIPTPALVKEVGDAALTSLDDYTGFIWPDEVRRFQQNTEGNFVGIGVQIRKAEDGGIFVVAPLEESPAWKLGIQNKDVIVSVDGTLVADWSLNDAVDRITGAEGTTVQLEIRRPDVEELLVFDVPRQRIEIPSVKGFQILERDEDGKPTWDWRLDAEAKIGYFRLNQFARNSHLDLIKAWNTLCGQFDSEPSGVVLDLRGNPGGLLESAAAITNLFLREGTVVTQESPGGRIERRVWARPDGNVFGEVPVVVLVDEGSASASEIVSGCSKPIAERWWLASGLSAKARCKPCSPPAVRRSRRSPSSTTGFHQSAISLVAWCTRNSTPRCGGLILKLRFGCPKAQKSVAEERGVCPICATPPHSMTPS